MPTQRAEKFEFGAYQIQSNRSEVTFTFKTTDFDGKIIDFVETLILPIDIDQQRDQGILDVFLKNIHLVLGVNYYKLFLPNKVVTPYSLNKSEANFWTMVYQNGLGEFAYRNKIDPSSIGVFEAQPGSERKSNQASVKDLKTLMVGIGGGKDALVSVELLKQSNLALTAFVCESPSGNNTLRREVVEQTSLKSFIAMRKPDAQLIDLRGSNLVYRGHTPMSAIIAWIGCFVAWLSDQDAFVVSNENSSNEPNLTWQGFAINHQWSKSFEFEKAFREFLVSQSIPTQYFSMVRPFNELLISQIFSGYREYFPVFFSCNHDNEKNPDKIRQKWCGQCAKCASSTLLLAPFLTSDEIKAIIGNNMLEDEAYNKFFEDLTGFGDHKPFECVCSYEEAVLIVHNLLQKPEYKDLPVIQHLAKKIDFTKIDIEKLKERVYHLDKNNFVPTELMLIITKTFEKLRSERIA